MGVVFKGGPSGMRQDYLPPVPSSGAKQPVQDTSTSGPEPSTVHFQAKEFERRHYQTATPDFLPTGGTEATGTDLADPTATMGGDESVFKGAPDTGTKGGPA